MERRRTLHLIAIALTAVVGGFVLWRALGPTTTTPPGTFVRFDDFDFTGLTATETSPGTYAVVVRVRNSARRVDFRFDPRTVHAFDANGNDLDVPAPPAATTLVAGESIERTLTFHGAEGLKELHIKFMFGGDIGSFMDSVLYGKREVALPVR